MEDKNLIYRLSDVDTFLNGISNEIFNLMAKLNVSRFNVEDMNLNFSLTIFSDNLKSVLLSEDKDVIKSAFLKCANIKVKDVFLDTERLLFLKSLNINRNMYLTLTNGVVVNFREIPVDELFTLYQIAESLERAVKKHEDETNNENPKKIHFENRDIIITDPCYIIKHEEPKYTYEEERESWLKIHELTKPIELEKLAYMTELENKWEENPPTISEIAEAKNKVKKFEKDIRDIEERYSVDKTDNTKYEVEEWGLTNYIYRNTIYGDWSCTTFDTDTNKPIGEFCADAGQVGVFDLEEVLRYNPDFDYHINKDKSHTTTLIKNFTGDVWFEVDKHEGTYKTTTKYHKEGEKWTDFSVHVVGKGNINFRTSQTGF